MTKQKQTAFLEAYEPCHDAFARYCNTLAFGKMDVNDLMQDVLLTAYHHFEKVKNKDQFLHYLIRAAKNRSISYWRKAKRQTELSEQHIHQLTAQEIAPETLLDIQLLHQTINQLPTKQRDALLLFEISGFSMKEIAQLQDSNVGAIKTKISRGRQKLRKMMAEKGIPVTVLSLFFGSNTVTAQPLIPTLKVPFQQFEQTVTMKSTLSEWFHSLFINSKIISMSSISLSTIVLIGSLYLVSTPMAEEISQSPTSQFIAEKVIMQEEINHKSYNKEVEQQSPIFKNVSPKSVFPEKLSTSSLDTVKPKKELIKPIPPAVPEPVLPSILSTKELTFPTLSSKEPLLPPVKELSLFSITEPQLPLFPVDEINPLFENIPEPLFPLEVMDTVLSLEDETWETGCDDPKKFDGDLKLFRKNIIRRLKNDNIYPAKAKMKLITFKNDKIRINGNFLSDDLQKQYLEFFDTYNIIPCKNNLIVITSDYIAVGKMTRDGFKGGMRGRVDISKLNKVKIE